MVKSVLLVKTSSLGDVVHALPAVSDLKLMTGCERIDWVVEESFSAIPRLHPAVTGVIPVAIRRWRKAWWRSDVRREIAGAIARIRRDTYDAVIDVQGLLKSALVTRAARGPRHGLDFHSSREPLGVFYQRTFRVPWTMHAVQRNRLLVARALGYEVPAGCDYGIRAQRGRFDWLVDGALKAGVGAGLDKGADLGFPRPSPLSRGEKGKAVEGEYVVLLHATSRDDKLWPEASWMALGRELNSAGLACVLPWGSEGERSRSERIAAALEHAIVPPALLLNEVAGLLAGAHAAVGVDTGLVHLAGALGVPTAGIYCSTDPAATGLHGCARAVNLGAIGRIPDVATVSSAIGELTR